jgi:fatty-acid desaturase
MASTLAQTLQVDMDLGKVIQNWGLTWNWRAHVRLWVSIAVAVASVVVLNMADAAPLALLPLGWLGLGTAMFLASSVVSSCALGTFTSFDSINSLVGTVLGLPLILSFKSLAVCMQTAQDSFRSLIDSSAWVFYGFVAFYRSNFRTWTFDTALNNLLMYAFVGSFVFVLYHSFGMIGLGKYYLAPLVVFYLWHSISIKAGRTLEISFQEDQALKRLADAIAKQYSNQTLTLPSVSRLLSKGAKLLSRNNSPRAVNLMEKFAGWEYVMSFNVSSQSLNEFKSRLAVQNEICDPDAEIPEGYGEPVDRTWAEYKPDYSKIAKIAVLHLGLYGAYLAFYGNVDPRTYVLGFLMYFFAGLGITAGYHRFWAHNSYKAVYAWQVFLAWMGAACGEGSIYWWSRDHRLHHKYSDTDRDPYPIVHGFWWAHIGWLMFNKNKKTLETGREMEAHGQMDDLKSQWLVRFQHKYYGLFFLGAGFLQPFLIASLWGDGWNGMWVAGALPLMWSFQSTMCVNSLAHMWGDRPYNPKISAVQNIIVAIITFGEGWHNFHHSFPMDFRCADKWYQWNPTKWTIQFLSYVGWTWDLRMHQRRDLAVKQE